MPGGLRSAPDAATDDPTADDATLEALELEAGPLAEL